MNATIDIRQDMTSRGKHGATSGIGYLAGMVAAYAQSSGVTVTERKGSLVKVSGDSASVARFSRYFDRTSRDIASPDCHPVHAAWTALLRAKQSPATATFADAVKVLPSLAPRQPKPRQQSAA